DECERGQSGSQRDGEPEAGAGVLAEPSRDQADKREDHYRRDQRSRRALPPYAQAGGRRGHFAAEDQRRPDIPNAETGRNRKQEDGEQSYSESLQGRDDVETRSHGNLEIAGQKERES